MGRTITFEKEYGDRLVTLSAWVSWMTWLSDAQGLSWAPGECEGSVWREQRMVLEGVEDWRRPEDLGVDLGWDEYWQV